MPGKSSTETLGDQRLGHHGGLDMPSKDRPEAPQLDAYDGARNSCYVSGRRKQ